ncbi:pentatricopeptide repeat domain-containing protein [Apiospora aurea]|uniref:Pentatricopeptide repeat domain-containing protein n=1 Tax=Apiospora aurea TaxID=335848 RepID=A0ABR1QYR8_9PEZI
MRSANRTLRDVKLRRPVPSLQPTRHLTLPSRLAQPVYRPHDALSTPWKRCIATAPATLDMTVPEPFPMPSDRLASRNPAANDTKSLLQQSASFGKWQWLSLKPGRLAIESDFSRTGPARKYHLPLQVDNLENQNDFGLWYCLLDYLQRHHGDEGVHRLWKGMWGRKALYSTDKTSSLVFWQTILETALRYDNEQFLENILVYAEWMKEIHNNEWPNLYMGILSHYLRSHQHSKALQWHLRLTPNFQPSSSEFTGLIKQFCTDKVLNDSGTLPRLYTISHERHVYDAVVPYLYALGSSQLARLWHKTCLNAGDGPTLYAPAKPFLRYFAGYYPESRQHWSEQEQAAMDTLDQHSSSQQNADENENGDFEQLEVSREFMNRVHGSTFGFTSKSYNDKLGARWFASSWVSLDTAISVVSALGIQQIGPLSLQSIALRDPSPEGVLRRIGHLRDLGIVLPETNYVKSIQYLAKIHDEELLLDLLQCDLHPDVFDDIELHSKLMDSSRASGDLRTYNILLATRLATYASSTHASANTMLAVSLTMEDHWNIIRVLGDMFHWKISVEPEHVGKLFELMQANAPMHPSEGIKQDDPRRSFKILPSPDDVRFCQALLWTLRRMDVPIPARINKQLVISLGRQGKMQLLLPVMRDLINYYTKRQSARPGFIPVAVCDLPKAMTRPLGGVRKLLGVYIPIDTPAERPHHPLSQIFTPRVVASLIRWSFRKIPESNTKAPLLQLQKKRLSPGFEFVRVIAVLRTLKDVGMNMNASTIRKAIILRLAELYGGVEPLKKSTKSVRRRNRLSLIQAKRMCDDAWGMTKDNRCFPASKSCSGKSRSWMCTTKTGMRSCG